MKPVQLRKLLTNRRRNVKILFIADGNLSSLLFQLPLIASFRKQLENAKLYILTSSSLQELIPIIEPLSGSILYHTEKHSSRISMRQYQNVLNEVRAYDFDMAIISSGDLRAAKLAKKAKIPIRLGPRNLFNFFSINVAYNYRWEKSQRSLSTIMLGILTRVGLRSDFILPELISLRNVKLKEFFPELVSRKKIVTLITTNKKNNLDKKTLVKLTSALTESNYLVIKGCIDSLTITFQINKKKYKFNWDNLNLRQQFELIGASSLIVSDSLSVMIIASLMKVAYVGLFAESKDAHWRKNRPFKVFEEIAYKDFLLAPDNSKGCDRCNYEKCEYFPCLPTIEVDRIVDAVELQTKLLDKRKRELKEASKISKSKKTLATKTKKSTKAPNLKK